MNRRSFINAAAAMGLMPSTLLAGCESLSTQSEKREPRVAANLTQWVVSPAVGLDACFALAIATADPSILQVKQHLEKRNAFREMLGPEGIKAGERMMRALAAGGRASTPGPGLAEVVSAGQMTTLQQVIDTFEIDGILEKGLEKSESFANPRARANVQRIRPVATAAFRALQRGGFETVWRSEEETMLVQASNRLSDQLGDVDIITQQRKYVARSRDAEITVYLSELCEPHGIKIIGQRFIASPNYSDVIIKRTAAHEMLHRLLDQGRVETPRIVERLSDDPLLKAVLKNADPTFGYTSDKNSVKGLIEEGAVEALEAVINENLGFGRDQKEYWRDHDGGMHVFAAATYALLHETGFARAGGDMLNWLDEQTTMGHLKGKNLQALASSIVGADSVQHWLEA